MMNDNCRVHWYGHMLMDALQMVIHMSMHTSMRMPIHMSIDKPRVHGYRHMLIHMLQMVIHMSMHTSMHMPIYMSIDRPRVHGYRHMVIHTLMYMYMDMCTDMSRACACPCTQPSAHASRPICNRHGHGKTTAPMSIHRPVYSTYIVMYIVLAMARRPHPFPYTDQCPIHRRTPVRLWVNEYSSCIG